MRRFLSLATGLVLACRAESGIDLSRYEMIDLSHPYSASTLYWPTSPSAFEFKPLHVGPTPAGFFYSAYTFCTPEHGGTHLDAPVHFAEGALGVDQVPLNQLIANAIVIDVRDSASANADYRLTVADVEAFERADGRIGPGTIVLLRTGWSARWGDRKAYFGDDTPNDATKLHFPGYGEEAARLLVEERQVAALGVDSPSVDYGPSQDFVVHRIGAPRGVPNFENLTNLDRLPATAAIVVALPMKIEAGSGGPLRAVALVPR
ncbi:MAG: cyclase family protein [Gemmatimonadales bacterium]